MAGAEQQVPWDAPYPGRESGKGGAARQFRQAQDMAAGLLGPRFCPAPGRAAWSECCRPGTGSPAEGGSIAQRGRRWGLGGPIWDGPVEA